MTLQNIQILIEDIGEIYHEGVVLGKQAKSKLNKLALKYFLAIVLRKRNSTTRDKLSFAKVKSLSCDDICSLYPERVRHLFASLDLDRQEMGKAKGAWQQDDLATACTALDAYYRQKTAIPSLLQDLDYSNRDLVLSPEDLIQDIFTLQSATATVPRHPNGLLNWNDQGPNNDREWTWFLNRHYHLLDLLGAYEKTGDLVYINQLNDQILDWILSCPSQDNPQIWGQWRGLEATFRVLHWSQIFYRLQQVSNFSAAARLLMLSSLLDHAYYLRHLNSWGANWLVKEMCGLATIALCWPEFKNAQGWLTYACDRLMRELPQQIYPDGVHKELTSHYHRAVLLDLQNLADLLIQSGSQMPADLKICLEKMWNYLAYSLRPDGYGLLNNDSDRDHNRPLVSQAARTYQRADWTYIATNGKGGQLPPGLPSAHFPWTGQMIMRSGWDCKAHWAFFDRSPMGVYYHIHNDKLHLSIAAYGRDLLVDSGRYSYVRNQFWRYFRGSASHNIILVDGRGQNAGVRESRQPMVGNYAIEPEFDFARGTFNRGFTKLKGKASHTRVVVYLRGKYWVVVDQITTDRPRLIEPLWHFHPDCSVAVEGDSVTSIDPNMGNLRIIPCSNLCWSVNLVQGQEDPVQGWWSGRYNQKTPSPTAIYSTQIDQSIAFAWVLLPAQGRVAHPKVHLKATVKDTVLLCLETQAGTQDMIAVRLSGNATIKLGNTWKLKGDCAILQPGQKPLVAYGVITDETGQVIVEHGQ